MGQQRIIGPNHALHGVLTLLTFWACGGWAWVWLLVAIQNRQRVATIDESGVVHRPTPQYETLGAFFIDDAGATRWANVALVASAVIGVILIAAVINL